MDLVEKERSPVGRFEEAGSGILCAGKGPAEVPEEFAFKERVWNGRYIGGYERVSSSQAPSMKSVRGHFFSCTRLSQKEDRPGKGSKAMNPIEEKSHGRTLPDHGAGTWEGGGFSRDH